MPSVYCLRTQLYDSSFSYWPLSIHSLVQCERYNILPLNCTKKPTFSILIRFCKFFGMMGNMFWLASCFFSLLKFTNVHIHVVWTWICTKIEHQCIKIISNTTISPLDKNKNPNANWPSIHIHSGSKMHSQVETRRCLAPEMYFEICCLQKTLALSQGLFEVLYVKRV